jgi:hypothetical protein
VSTTIVFKINLTIDVKLPNKSNIFRKLASLSRGVTKRSTREANKLTPAARIPTTGLVVRIVVKRPETTVPTTS